MQLVFLERSLLPYIRDLLGNTCSMRDSYIIIKRKSSRMLCYVFIHIYWSIFFISWNGTHLDTNIIFLTWISVFQSEYAKIESNVPIYIHKNSRSLFKQIAMKYEHLKYTFFTWSNPIVYTNLYSLKSY